MFRLEFHVEDIVFGGYGCLKPYPKQRLHLLKVKGTKKLIGASIWLIIREFDEL